MGLKILLISYAVFQIPIKPRYVSHWSKIVRSTRKELWEVTPASYITCHAECKRSCRSSTASCESWRGGKWITELRM